MTKKFNDPYTKYDDNVKFAEVFKCFLLGDDFEYSNAPFKFKLYADGSMVLFDIYKTAVLIRDSGTGDLYWIGSENVSEYLMRPLRAALVEQFAPEWRGHLIRCARPFFDNYLEKKEFELEFSNVDTAGDTAAGATDTADEEVPEA